MGAHAVAPIFLLKEEQKKAPKNGAFTRAKHLRVET